MRIKKRVLLTILISLGILVSPGAINHAHADVIIMPSVQTASRSKMAAKTDQKRSVRQSADEKINQPTISNVKSKSRLKNKSVVKVGPKLSSSRSKHQIEVTQERLQDRLNRSLSNDRAHCDNNRQQISGMNHFAKKRANFYYPQVSFNTRDLGGYVTTDNRYQVRPDRIIRSANLQNLSSKGLKELKKLRVYQDIDLRFSDQIKKRPDPGEPESSYLKGTKIFVQDDPVYSAQEDAAMHPGIHANGEWYFYGRSATDKHNAIKAYRRIFKDLLTNRHGAILYHCDVGRDRTGVVSALILSALGVKRNTIYHDYLLTDYYRRKNRMHAMPYSQQAGELKHFFDTVNHQDGSVSQYLQKVIGLKHKDIMRLRSMYLEPVD